MGEWFLGLLGLLFIGLKLAGIIAWSWWLVLLPLYVGLVILLGVWLLAMLVALIGSLFVNRRYRR